MSFSIKSDKLIDYTLRLQRINDVALPYAMQNTLNAVVRDVKKKTLLTSANKHFSVDKPGFFKANSGYKSYNAKQFNYNINRMRAEVGMVKSAKPNEKATEQIAHQETGQAIKRSINPLGTKPQSKAIIDILSKKPEIYQNEADGFNPYKYYRSAARAKKYNSPLLFKNSSGTRGSVGIVKKFQSRKRTKTGYGRIDIKIMPIASYIHRGFVKLKMSRPFLQDAAQMSASSMMENTFIKEAQKQVERALKR